jgi:flagellar basal-body rod protein FlgG
MPLASNIAATGLMAAQTRIDVVAQNLANIKTTAYQKWMVETSDLFYNQVKRAGIPQNNTGSIRPVGVQQGTGTEVSGIYRVMTPGNLVPTKNPLDMAIVGAGYFAILLPNGRVGYTRTGSFQFNAADRTLKTVNGYELADGISIPDDIDVNAVQISEDGVVSGQNRAGVMVPIGNIELFSFANEKGLEAIGDNIFVETDASGLAEGFDPSAPGLGKLKQYHLEESNVSPVTELTDLIDAQRAYEFNSKVLMASNEMQKTAAEIYKG